MEQRSPGSVPEEWRQHWLSGQALCRTAMGMAYRGGVVVTMPFPSFFLFFITLESDQKISPCFRHQPRLYAQPCAIKCDG
jgi:hypothetical protein